MELIVDSQHGVYIPQRLARLLPEEDMTNEQRQVLMAGPCHDDYWDVFDDVIDTPLPNGDFLIVDGDGAVFLLPHDWEYNDLDEEWRPPLPDGFYMEEAPSYFAQIIFYDDYTSLDDDDVIEYHTWLEGCGIKEVSSISNNTFVGRYNGILHEMSEYVVVYS